MQFMTLYNKIIRNFYQTATQIGKMGGVESLYNVEWDTLKEQSIYA